MSARLVEFAALRATIVWEFIRVVIHFQWAGRPVAGRSVAGQSVAGRSHLEGSCVTSGEFSAQVDGT